MNNYKNMKREKKTFAEKAYKKTNVDSARSEEQMKKMLLQLGIDNIRFTQEGLDHSIEFMVKLQHHEYPRKVRVNLPMHKELDETDGETEQNKNVMYRVALWHLKNKFVAVHNKLKEFEEEFLDDLVIVSNGRERRLGDVIVPQYKEQLKNNKVAVLSINTNTDE